MAPNTSSLDNLSQILRLTPENKRLLEQVLDAVSDYVSVHDMQGRVIYVNESACRLFGKSAQELMRYKTLFSNYDAYYEDGTKVTADNSPLRNVILHKRPTEAIVRMKLRRGELEHWVRAKSFPVLGEDGTPLIVVNVFIDITESRLREAQLRETSERAISALKETLQED